MLYSPNVVKKKEQKKSKCSVELNPGSQTTTGHAADAGAASSERGTGETKQHKACVRSVGGGSGGSGWAGRNEPPILWRVCLFLYLTVYADVC